jgi:hypothetical protein
MVQALLMAVGRGKGVCIGTIGVALLVALIAPTPM